MTDAPEAGVIAGAGDGHAGTRRREVVVIGASMAGLLTARTLADHVDHVTVLERERLADEPAPRGHVPQGRHPHILLKAGEDRITQWFPGIRDDLLAAGAVVIDGTRAVWYQMGGYRVRGDWGGTGLSLTRPLLELEVRRHLRRVPNVTLEDGVRVERPVLEGGRVTGVVVAGQERRADLVVDCTGRNSKVTHQLTGARALEVPVEHVKVDIAYATRLLRRRPDDLDGAIAAVLPTPPHSFRCAVLVPVEGDRWMVTLWGMHGDVPPADDEGYLAFARSLPVPVPAQVLEHCEPLSPVVEYRYPSSQRRRFERAGRHPAGFVALGDSSCSFNPVYGQGISSSALQAEVLAQAVASTGLDDPGLARAFYPKAAKIIDMAWTIAVGSDFMNPRTTGPRPPAIDLTNRYVTKVVHATHTSLPVTRSLTRVQGLEAPATSLLRPATVLRVLRAARHSPAETGAPLAHPWVAGPVAAGS